MPDDSSACAVLLLRNDTYNNSTHTFSSTSTYPSHEVFVCLEASNVLDISPAQYIGGVSYDVNTNFSEYSSTNTAADLSYSWPINIFVSSNVSTFLNLDILAFIRYLYNHGSISTSNYVVGAQIGFKAHSGHVIYQLLSVDLTLSGGSGTTVSVITPVPSNPNPTTPTPTPTPTITPIVTPIVAPIVTPTTTPTSTSPVLDSIFNE
jgi:hypothetical protein